MDARVTPVHDETKHRSLWTEQLEDPGSYKTKSPGRPGLSAYTLAGRSNAATVEPDDGFGCSYHWIAKTMATTRMTPVVSIKISAAS
jgi:hypothetical protein